jgi:hypothetical protein
MLGRLKSDQGQLFYEFRLGDAVPEDHLVRKIDIALDLSWLRSELAPHYSSVGRPSIDPELMIRMLVVGYVFAIRSETSVMTPPPMPLLSMPSRAIDSMTDQFCRKRADASCMFEASTLTQHARRPTSLAI